LFEQQFDICAMQYIKVPTLIAAMGAYHMLRDEEMMYDRSAACRQRLRRHRRCGAELHRLQECEMTPGQYGNSLKNCSTISRNGPTPGF
jgi:hypothetical protein